MTSTTFTLEERGRALSINGHAPRGGELAAMALVTLLVRLIVIVAARGTEYPIKDVPSNHRTLWSYATDWGDGPSYVAQARAMRGDPSTLTEFDKRVFPGYPAMIALLNCAGVPFERAAMLLPWVCSGLAAAFAAMLFCDRRVGWGMAFLIPHYLSYSAMPMSEAVLLALLLGGAVLARDRTALLGGMLMGFAGLVRPVAAFGVVGYFAFELMRGRGRRGVVAAIAAGVTVAAGIALLHWWTGNAFRGVQVYANDKAAYGGNLFTWPFHSLIATPRRADLPELRKAKVAYIYIHVVLALAACAILVRRYFRTGSATHRLDTLALPWLLLNTGFILCVGSRWGFFCFPRFTVPALPAALWAFRDVLPKRWWGWAIVVAPSMAIAVDAVHRMN